MTITENQDVEDHVQALVDILREQHERFVITFQRLADEAAARGDPAAQQWCLDRVARAEAKPKPWLPGQPATS